MHMNTISFLRVAVVGFGALTTWGGVEWGLGGEEAATLLRVRVVDAVTGQPVEGSPVEVRSKQLASSGLGRHWADRANAPSEEYCAADVVIDTGTCGDELLPTIIVRYEANSKSGLCPPGSCVVDAVVKCVHLPETRLGDNYNARTKEFRVRADGCGILGPKVEQPVYTINPLQLGCILSVRAVCSACESH
jgi:hypothetical protein